jgi:hypothetical protein
MNYFCQELGRLIDNPYNVNKTSHLFSDPWLWTTSISPKYPTDVSVKGGSRAPYLARWTSAIECCFRPETSTRYILIPYPFQRFAAIRNPYMLSDEIGPNVVHVVMKGLDDGSHNR